MLILLEFIHSLMAVYGFYFVVVFVKEFITYAGKETENGADRPEYRSD